MPAARKSGSAGSIAVDAYLAHAPPPMRSALRELRATVRRAAPAAEERIGYRMPALWQDGWLVYYAAFSDHLSFFPGSATTRERFRTETKPFAGGKGTLRFDPAKPLPKALIGRIVRSRVAENRARAKARSSGTGAQARRTRR